MPEAGQGIPVDGALKALDTRRKVGPEVLADVEHRDLVEVRRDGTGLRLESLDGGADDCVLRRFEFALVRVEVGVEAISQDLDQIGLAEQAQLHRMRGVAGALSTVKRVTRPVDSRSPAGLISEMKFFRSPAKSAISVLPGVRASTDTRYDLPAWLGPKTPTQLRRVAEAASFRPRF